ncbi:MAG: sugar phosphate nucleotidyltransferase [Opitutales bacterium]|nr:sugar phosphate nucleotidyltransferase [Opitutales bacterium]
MSNRFVVIMAGGRGERFWPQSRLKKPKHLLPIVGDKAMLAQAVDRVLGLVPPENIFIITNTEQREAVLEICPEVLPAQVVGEPVGRDTAAAVGLAAVLVQERNPEGAFAILPADHVIHDTEGFQKTLALGFEQAEKGEYLVTIGIDPTEPATGYGYIHRGEQASSKNPVFKVQRFVEKPDLETAKGYLASGEYAWNAGMFVWKALTVRKSIIKYVPELEASLTAIQAELSSGAELSTVLALHYPDIQKISIDFAVMEKADNVLTIPAAFDWDDVGEWPAVARHYEADAGGNVSRGKSVLKDSSGNIIFSDEGHLVALLGVDDLIVVRTEDATLVCHKDQAQKIKELVSVVGEELQ